MTAKKKKASGTPVTVESFLESGRERLGLELLAGNKGLAKRKIRESAINRVGFALTGFFEYFPEKRIQVIGLAEHTYLGTLSEKNRINALRDLFKRKIPCVVVTRGRKLYPEICKLGDEFATPVLKTPSITKHFINAATILMENLRAPRMKIQGTMMEIEGMGVLIAGKSGLGKSETALALIKSGYTLVADDITSLRKDTSGAIIASPVKITQYHMEVKGLGIIHVPSLFGVSSVRENKRLDLVVRLNRDGETETTGGPNTCDILGVPIPEIDLAVRPGRSLADVVETAALNEKLKRLGHDAEKELDEQLMALLSEGKNGSD